MKALLLAAGQGQRMRPHSLHTPKPLMYYGKYRLIEYNLFNLAKAGFKEVFINLSYRSQDFYPILQDGAKYNLKITYIFEPTGGLEAGGTIASNIDLFNNESFLMLSSDLYTNFDLSYFKTLKPQIAHILVKPTTNGLFTIKNNNLSNAGNDHDYANIGVFNPKAFVKWPKNCKIKLGIMFNQMLQQNLIINTSTLPSNNIWQNITNYNQIKKAP